MTHKSDKILNIYKPVGISPLDAIKALKEKHPELKDEKMTYAGRLDPLAEGVLVILAGNAVYEKEKYLKLNKEYEAEILFGFNTDTYDILGLPENNPQSSPISRFNLDIGVKKLEGGISLPLPPYSSYKIKGKPLFQWARDGKLGEIEIPMRQTKINSAELLSFDKISGQKLLEKIEQKINSVQGDFRQKEILKKWQGKMLPNLSDLPATLSLARRAGSKNKEAFWIAKIKINCSSGTYIRSIAHHLGKELKIGGVILSLTRTKVGNFEIKDSLRI